MNSGPPFPRIAVDLTPLLPGGENGGAKLMALELIRALSRHLPEWQFVLLTAERTHEELSFLEAQNVRRRCVCRAGKGESSPPAKRLRFREWARYLPRPIRARLKSLYFAWRRRPVFRAGVLREIEADLLFCPFTMPFFQDPAVPTVSVIYDLQHRYYPQFFEGEDRYDRERNFREACRLADRLVCISEYVRGTVLEYADLPPQQVVTVPIRLIGCFQIPPAEIISAAAQKYGLQGKEYLFYPANFWPHKNHELLFTAFGMFLSRHPESEIDLVCTGSPGKRMEWLKEASRRMGLQARIHFPGYLAAEEYAGLLASCRALIFPSLFEGFGMPIPEAMAAGKPVLCSRVTSLPEVAGEAALFFDPRRPAEILAAIERITADPELARELVEKGRSRADSFHSVTRMAEEYLAVFREVIRHPRRSDFLEGIYPDGWTGNRVVIGYAPHPHPGFLDVTLQLPPAYPHRSLSVTIDEANRPGRTYRLRREKPLAIHHRLAAEGGVVQLIFDPVFQPRAQGLNGDERWLACICRECVLASGSGRKTLWRMEPKTSGEPRP